MKKSNFANVFFLFLFFSSISVNAQKSNYVLLYQDEFNNDSVNTNDWYYRDSEVSRFGGYSQKENVSVETEDGIGYLNIAYNKWDVNGDDIVDPVGGGVISKKTFGYGYYEAKIKFYNTERGFHQSFWTAGAGYYSNYSAEYGYNEDAKNEIVPWTNGALEIDGIELNSDYDFGSANFHWHQPIFVTPSGAGHDYLSSYMDLNDWITVAFEWKPGVIINYIDGVEKHRFTYTDARYAPQELWLSALANTHDFFGGGGTPEAGASMKVDYFRYYGDKPFNSNIIGNFSFESNNKSSEVPYNWIQADETANNIYYDESKVVFDTAAFDGFGYLKHECQTNSGYMTTKQRLDYIPNGSYRLSAWVKSSGGLSSARMRALYGENELYVDIPESASWIRIIIDSINVTSHSIVIAFTTSGDDGEWIKVDKVELIDKSFVLPFEPSEIVIDNEDQEYSEVGTWSTSGLTGYNGSSTRYAGNAIGPYAQWTPNIVTASDFNVYIYKVVNSNSDTNAKIDIVYNGGNDTKYLDYSTGTSGWIYLGTYNFATGTSGYVRNSLNTSGKYARADAIKLQKVELVIDNGDANYSEVGAWSTSGLTGFNETDTRYAGSAIGHYAQWTPNIMTASDFNVYIYKVVNSNSDTNAKIDIVYNGGNDTKYLDYSTGTSGWVYLGTYNFASGSSGYVRNSLNTSGKYARADAIKLQKVELVIDNGDANYSEVGAWSTSGLTGFNETDTRYAGNAIGPYAQWTPNIVTTSDFNVYIYKIVNSNSDTNAKIDIVYNGGNDTKYLDYSTGTSGWVYLGTYNFASGSSGYVRNSLNTSGKYARADAVYFEQTPAPLSENEGMFNIKNSITKTESVSETKSITKMIISPNPVNDYINIKIEGEQNNPVNIKLIDIRGVVLKSFDLQTQTNSFFYNMNVSELKKGLYILVVENNSVISINKIFKN